MQNFKEKICVMGLGYIGLPTAALLACNGYKVIGVDTNPNIVSNLNKGAVHIVEPDLDLYVKKAVESKSLKVFSTPQISDIYIICVPTPFYKNEKLPTPNLDFINDAIKKSNFYNIEVLSDESIKSQILSNSIFAVAKSGTVSLEICNSQIPSIIIYKMNFLNFMIVKSLVKIKYANIINIINNKEVIPELIQNECNPKEIFKSVVYFLKNPVLMDKQINEFSNTLDEIRSKTSSADEASSVLLSYITS